MKLARSRLLPVSINTFSEPRSVVALHNDLLIITDVREAFREGIAAVYIACEDASTIETEGECDRVLDTSTAE